MMKYISFLFILFSSNCFAQVSERVETPFNSFIKLPSVEWAMGIRDTISFEKLDIKYLLIKKMLKKEIKTSQYFISDSKEEVNLRYSSLEDNMIMLYGNHYDHDFPMFDNLGNQIPSKPKLNKIDTSTRAVEINEKILIENGKLISIISYVAPIQNLITPSGLNLGAVPIFYTAFNKGFQIKFTGQDSILNLGIISKNIFLDSIKNEHKYKETFGKNLVETIWPFLISDKYKIIDLESNKSILGEKIVNTIYKDHKVIKEILDSNGNYLTTAMSEYPFNPNIFKKVTLHQTWYYNDTKISFLMTYLI